MEKSVDHPVERRFAFSLDLSCSFHKLCALEKSTVEGVEVHEPDDENDEALQRYLVSFILHLLEIPVRLSNGREFNLARYLFSRYHFKI